MQLQDDYFTAYHSLKLTRDADGVLVARISHQRRAVPYDRTRLIRSLSMPSTGFRRIERTRS